MKRPLHHAEWHEKYDRDCNWDDQPRFIIINGKQIYEKSRHKNDQTWRGFANASTVKNAELITRLLMRHEKETKPKS